MLIFRQNAQSGNEPLLIMLELFGEGSLDSHAGAFFSAIDGGSCLDLVTKPRLKLPLGLTHGHSLRRHHLHRDQLRITSYSLSSNNMNLFLAFLLYILHAAECLPLNSPLLDSYDYISEPTSTYYA